MTIQFCPTCKSILIPTTKNSKHYLICKTCQTCEPTKNTIIQPEKIKHEKTGKGVAEKTDFSGQKFKCEKCGNDKCKIVDIGCMIGDEDWIYLQECTKCGWSDRVGEWC